MKISLSLSLSLLIFIVIMFAVSPAVALGAGNRNLFLIGVMAISPLILLKYQKLYKFEIWLLLFMLSIVLIPFLYHPESMRWSTVIYTLMFGFTFMAYIRLLYRNIFTISEYQKVLKYLIYAYFIVLLIQQLNVLTGTPIFNVSNYDPVNPWKLNSLAAEPSHSARIVGLLMYCYIVVTELLSEKAFNFRKDFNKNKYIWIAFLWTMLTVETGTALLFTSIVLLKITKLKQLPVLTLVVISLIVIILLGGLNMAEFERTFNVVMATLTLESQEMIDADHSASIRIIPLIFIAEVIDLATFDGWLGHGVDATKSFLFGKVPGVHEGFSGGGLLQLLFDYGFISFVLFILFSLTTTFNKKDYLSIVFWFFLVFFNSINSQIVWLALILLFTNKYFQNIRTQRSVK